MKHLETISEKKLQKLTQNFSNVRKSGNEKNSQLIGTAFYALWQKAVEHKTIGIKATL